MKEMSDESEIINDKKLFEQIIMSEKNIENGKVKELGY